MNEFIKKLIERLKSEVNYNDGAEIGSKQAIEIVNQVAEEHKSTEHINCSSDGSTDGWIPCSEKTPSGEFYHLVSTVKGGRTIARYRGYGRWWDLHGYEVEDEVIAWQPLPQAYQPKGE